MAVTLEDIKKLRELTKAGIADCKKALAEANGNMEEAIKLIRERGQAIAAKRTDRAAEEGCCLSGNEGGFAAIVAVKCETDFVANNADFIGMTKDILAEVLKNKPASTDDVLALSVNGMSVKDLIADRSGVTGEKMEFGAFESLEGASVASYVHQGNKLCTLVSFKESGVSAEVGKNIAMQIAGYNPVSIDADSVPADIKQRELEIGMEKARQDGKPENMLERIAQGRLQKFYKESTLLAQPFLMDEKITVAEYLKKNNATVVAFKRVNLNQD